MRRSRRKIPFSITIFRRLPLIKEKNPQVKRRQSPIRHDKVALRNIKYENLNINVRTLCNAR